MKPKTLGWIAIPLVALCALMGLPHTTEAHSSPQLNSVWTITDVTTPTIDITTTNTETTTNQEGTTLGSTSCSNGACNLEGYGGPLRRGFNAITERRPLRKTLYGLRRAQPLRSLFGRRC